MGWHLGSSADGSFEGHQSGSGAGGLRKAGARTVPSRGGNWQVGNSGGPRVSGSTGGVGRPSFELDGGQLTR